MVAVDKVGQKEFLQGVVEKFWETFPLVWDEIRSNARKIATSQFEISLEQFQTLRHIRRGRKSVSELAEVRQISRSAISQAVDKLVDRGLISRKQSSQDRRHIGLDLTDEGNALLNAIFAENRRWMVEKLASMDPEEAGIITTGLEALKNAFK